MPLYLAALGPLALYSGRPLSLGTVLDRTVQCPRTKGVQVQGHVAQMVPRLELSEEERAVVVEILLDYLHDKSKMVKTFSMQALSDLAEQDAGLRSQVIQLLEELTRTGSPAMKSRGRKLLEKLGP